MGAPEERFERMERTPEFVATNQSQHDAQIAENSKQIAENWKHIRENSQQIGGDAQQLGEFVRLASGWDAAAEEQGNHIDRLAERVDTLTGVVERYFSDVPVDLGQQILSKSKGSEPDALSSNGKHLH